MNSIMLEAIAELAPRGIEPPVWRSSNSPGGDEANVDGSTARYGRRAANLLSVDRTPHYPLRRDVG